MNCPTQTTARSSHDGPWVVGVGAGGAISSGGVSCHRTLGVGVRWHQTIRAGGRGGTGRAGPSAGDLLPWDDVSALNPARHGQAKYLGVIHHSRAGTTWVLCDAAVRAATGVTDSSDPVELRVLGAFDAGPDDVLGDDALLLATPAHFGYMSGALKDFFERIYRPCLEDRRPALRPHRERATPTSTVPWPVWRRSPPACAGIWSCRRSLSSAPSPPPISRAPPSSGPRWPPESGRRDLLREGVSEWRLSCRLAGLESGGPVDGVDDDHVGDGVVGTGHNGVSAPRWRGRRRRAGSRRWPGGCCAPPCFLSLGPDGQPVEAVGRQRVQHPDLAVVADDPQPDAQDLRRQHRAQGTPGHPVGETESASMYRSIPGDRNRARPR
jgi:hypothetical protein